MDLYSTSSENKLSYVITTISIPKEQSKFLKEGGYSPSRLFQNTVRKLMESKNV